VGREFAQSQVDLINKIEIDKVETAAQA